MERKQMLGWLMSTVVVVALGLVSGAAAARSVATTSERLEAADRLLKIYAALASYREHHGAWPVELGAVASQTAVVDPWGRRYVYSLLDSEPVVTSVGPDAKPGTADDVSLEQLAKAGSPSVFELLVNTVRSGSDRG